MPARRIKAATTVLPRIVLNDAVWISIVTPLFKSSVSAVSRHNHSRKRRYAEKRFDVFEK